MGDEEEWFYRSLMLAVRINSLSKVKTILETHPESINFFYHDQAYRILVYALHNRRIEIAKCFIQHDCLVEMVSETNFYYTSLYYAVKFRDLELVKLLLSHNAPINDQDRNKETALCLAYKIKFLEAVKLMLTKYFKQNKQLSICSDNDMTAFFIACLTHNQNAIKGFFNFGFQANVRHSALAKGFETIEAIKHQTFDLFYAVTNEYVGLVHLLANQRDQIVKKNADGLTPLHLAFILFTKNRIHKSSCLQMLDSMLSWLTEPIENCIEQNGISHFHIACSRSNMNVIKHFIHFGVDINKPISVKSKILGGYTPLHCAADFKSTSIIPLLLRNNANINAVDKDGYTPLHLLFLSYEHSKSENEAGDSIKTIFTEYCDRIEICANKYGLSHFHVACALGDVTIVDTFLKKGANVNGSVTDASEVLSGYSPLHCAVAHNNVEVAKFLLQNNADINLRNTDGSTPLHTAFNNWKSKKYQDESSEIFLDLLLSLCGENIENSKDKNGLSHLHIACMRSNIKVVENFIKQGVDINEKVVSSSAGIFRYTPLQWAVYFNKLEVVKVLLQHNADMNIDDDDEFVPKIPVFTAISVRINEAMNQVNSTCNDFIMYLKSGHPLERLFIYNRQQESDKFKWDDNFEIIRLLLENGSNVNKVSFFREPLILVLCNNDLYTNISAAFNGLNDQFYDFKKIGFDYLSELVCDSYYTKRNEIVKMFINQGLDLNLRNRDGFTFLHNLAFSMWEKDKSIELAEFILEKGFNANVRSKTGLTPLHLAASSHNEELVKLLLKYRAEVNSATNDRKTPLALACSHTVRNKSKFTEIINLLVENGADINAKDKNGQTLLFDCCATLKAEVLQLLLQLGADIDVWDKKGDSVINLIDKLTFESCSLEAVTMMYITFHDHILAMKLLNSDRKTFVSQKLCKSLTAFKRKRNSNRSTDFLNECSDEIEYLKSINLDGYSTLYDLLFKSKNEMSIYIKNDKFTDVLNSSNFESFFKYYGFLLKNKYKEGVRRAALLNPAKRLLTFIIDNELPDSCSENIFKYFSDGELKRFLKFA